MATDILADLQARGFCLRANGDRLQIAPAERLTDDLLETIREHKPDLLRALTTAELDEDAKKNISDHRATEEAGRELSSDDGMERRRQEVLQMLHQSPEVERTFRAEQVGDEMRIALAIRNVGTCELVIDAARWEPFQLLALLEEASGTDGDCFGPT